MRPEEVLRLRMASLLLGRREARTPRQVVTWFGAMQAQDLASGEWSFGLRIPGATQGAVDQATHDREILRTWPMRGTVHFVAPEDAKWLLALTGVRALAGAAGRRAHLGLDEATVNKAAEVLAGALSGGKRLSRAECVDLLIEAGVHTAKEHGYHLLWYTSQIGVTCIGPQQGKEQTFVLLDEWVPNPRTLSREEALAELAVRYFQSHGPTTRQDFAGWTGLAMADVRLGIDGAATALQTIDVEGSPYVMAAALRDEASRILAEAEDTEVWILPGFDEYLLGFKDRSLMVSRDHMKTIIPGSNGVFMPTIVSGGRVIGTWKREVKRTRVDLRPLPFAPFTPAQQSGFSDAAETYGRYLGLDANCV